MIDKHGNLNALGYSNLGVASGLELYLPLEKDIRDYSGNGHTTQAIGGAVQFNKTRQAANFVTGTDNWIKVPTFLMKDKYITNKKTPLDMTIVFDVFMPVIQGQTCIFCYQNNVFNLFIKNNSTSDFIVSGASHITIMPLIFSSNTWYTISIRISELFPKFRLQGIVNGTFYSPITTTFATFITNNDAGDESFNIGMDYDGAITSDFYKGLLKNFKVFTRVLTDEELKIEYELRRMDRGEIPKKSIMASDGILYLPYGASINNLL